MGKYKALCDTISQKTKAIIEGYSPVFGLRPIGVNLEFYPTERQVFEIRPIDTNCKKFSFFIPKPALSQYRPETREKGQTIFNRFVEEYIPVHEAFEVIYMRIDSTMYDINAGLRHALSLDGAREVIAKCNLAEYKQAISIIGRNDKPPYPRSDENDKIAKIGEFLGIERAVGFSLTATNIFVNLSECCHEHYTGNWDWKGFSKEAIGNLINFQEVLGHGC